MVGTAEYHVTACALTKGQNARALKRAGSAILEPAKSAESVAPKTNYPHDQHNENVNGAQAPRRNHSSGRPAQALAPAL